MTHEILFEAEKISKKFGAHYALRDISFEIRSGEVLGPVSYTHLDVYKRQYRYIHICATVNLMILLSR